MECYAQFYKYAKRLALKWRHTRQMIMDKLIAKGASTSLAEKVVTSLSNDGIINDAKVFELDIFMMEEKRYGYKRVKEYLLKKSFSSELLDTYVFNKEIEKDNCYYPIAPPRLQFCLRLQNRRRARVRPVRLDVRPVGIL